MLQPSLAPQWKKSLNKMKASTARKAARITMPVVPSRSSRDLGGSGKFSTAYLLGMRGKESAVFPVGMPGLRSLSRVGNTGGPEGAMGREETGGAPLGAGRTDEGATCRS